jgi:hypothetical protein
MGTNRHGLAVSQAPPESFDRHLRRAFEHDGGIVPPSRESNIGALLVADQGR